MRYSSGQVHQAQSQRAAFMVYFLEVGSFGAQIIESCEQCSLGLSRAAALTPGTVRHEYMAHMDGVGGRWRGELSHDSVKAAGKGKV